MPLFLIGSGEFFVTVIKRAVYENCELQYISNMVAV